VQLLLLREYHAVGSFSATQKPRGSGERRRNGIETDSPLVHFRSVLRFGIEIQEHAQSTWYIVFGWMFRRYPVEGRHEMFGGFEYFCSVARRKG